MRSNFYMGLLWVVQAVLFGVVFRSWACVPYIFLAMLNFWLYFAAPDVKGWVAHNFPNTTEWFRHRFPADKPKQ